MNTAHETSLGCPTVAMVGCGDTGTGILSAADKALPDYDLVGIDPDVDRAARMLGGAGRVRLASEFRPGEQPACGVPGVKPQILPGMCARLFARQTVVGAGRALERGGRAAHDLKVAVTSPGGTTQAGLAALEGSTGLPALLPAAAGAAFGRALERARR